MYYTNADIRINENEVYKLYNCLIIVNIDVD